MLDPVYDLHRVNWLRSHAAVYIHGHSAGGTNPSLVEAMCLGLPVFAFDCVYNRATTENRCLEKRRGAPRRCDAKVALRRRERTGKRECLRSLFCAWYSQNHFHKLSRRLRLCAARYGRERRNRVLQRLWPHEISCRRTIPRVAQKRSRE